MADFDLCLKARYNKTGGGLISHKTKPIICYKHVNVEYAELFRSGQSIQIASYEYYRRGEGDRVDPLEGLAINRSGPGNLYWHAHSGNKGAQELIRTIMPNWQEHPRVANFLIQDYTASYERSPSYLFCASFLPDFDLIRAGVRCFMISDLVEFAYQLMKARPDLLQSANVGPVTYEPRDVDVTELGFRSSDPFRKNEKFRFENEVRIVFNPGEIPVDPLRLNVPFVPKLSTEIFDGFLDIGESQYIKANIN